MHDPAGLRRIARPAGGLLVAPGAMGTAVMFVFHLIMIVFTSK